MYTIAKPLFLMTETPLHAGSGDSLGVIDLPIQRERITLFPKIESSSLKGGVREALEIEIRKDFSSIETDYAKIHRVFGYDEGSLSKGEDGEEAQLRALFQDEQGAPARDFAGCLGFTDARLLLFPIKSAKGVFAWITCPLVLQRLYDDLRRAGTKGKEIHFLKDLAQKEEGYCMSRCRNSLAVKRMKTSYTVLLEEYSFKLPVERKDDEKKPLRAFADWLADILFPGNNPDTLFWRDKLKRDVVVLSNDDFGDFVQLSTEVITRIKIDNTTGSVAVDEGGLFTEEYLPSESLLYTIVQAAPELNRAKGNEEDRRTGNKKDLSSLEVLTFFHERLNDHLQLGGNASLGKGLIQTFVKLLKDE